MLCDFAAGLEVVSFHHLVPREMPRIHKPQSMIHEKQKMDNISDPIQLPTNFRVIEAGSWHNHFPGETRIHLDYAGVVSFYDTALFPSLKTLYSGKERWEHRLKGITSEDVETLWKTMGIILQGAWDRPVRSGIAWKTFLRVIVDRYVDRLQVLNHMLNSTMLESEEDITLALKKAQIYPASPPSVHHDSIPKYSWAIPVFKEYIDSISHTLTYSEHLLLNSTKSVSKEICRVIVGMWAEGMEHSVSKGGFTRSGQELVTRWKALIEELMTWLDWSEWVTCQPACGDEEICYLPTWPFFTGGPSMPDDGPDDSIKPQPRCIRRIEL
ncbi:hypothetical protein BYT27DRAFT_7195791 [Phlegmacium glaucopus]|nr:hypothetical protein BYT27DRAFT_7195791 [Phlegmacium glaucopus]